MIEFKFHWPYYFIYECDYCVLQNSNVNLPFYLDTFDTPTRPVEKPFRCSVADIFKGES